MTFRTSVGDAAHLKFPARDAIRIALRVARPTHDDWSPEAREAAAKARKDHAMGTHVKINAPGIKGHSESGHINNRPASAGGRHFVKTASGETHGPFHAHQVAATGKAAAASERPREEHVPTGAGRSIPRSQVKRVTKSLLG